ncbi:MAG TPA: anthranilate/aminodeoxychorismate synthase component II, partial [Acidimicrobiales bacterium]|nr:anthranilate/aminodeoxychorismate synthase component II [Acidimicrobiales bacterium]
MGLRVLVIDNYDSFVYNLAQYLGELGATPLVRRHDALDLDQVDSLAPDAVLVSPGPGRPDDAGLSNEVISHLAGHVPVLGVCLGHQCIGQIYGGRVVRAPQVVHGRT